MIDLYKIEGTNNICEYDLNHPCYNTIETWPSFQTDFERFKLIILENKPINIIRICDGEFGFLEQNYYGNINTRHVSKYLDTKPFFDGIYNSDFRCTQLYSDWTSKFKTLLKIEIDFPMEYVYAIVANKWIFKQNKKIGLIGSRKKLNIIKRLMEFEQYRNYIGIESFTDYIEVDETFMCDNITYWEKFIRDQLNVSSSEIFLYGIGISKLALSNKFLNYKKATYIDIGCGISALAGTTSLERPYYGDWTNFRLKGFNYDSIDQMDYKDTKGKNEIEL